MFYLQEHWMPVKLELIESAIDMRITKGKVERKKVTLKEHLFTYFCPFSCLSLPLGVGVTHTICLLLILLAAGDADAVGLSCGPFGGGQQEIRGCNPSSNRLRMITQSRQDLARQARMKPAVSRLAPFSYLECILFICACVNWWISSCWLLVLSCHMWKVPLSSFTLKLLSNEHFDQAEQLQHQIAARS